MGSSNLCESDASKDTYYIFFIRNCFYIVSNNIEIKVRIGNGVALFYYTIKVILSI